MPAHYDIRFAGTTDEALRIMCTEYDEWDATGVLHEHSLLREKGAQYAPGVVGITAAALCAFRELAKRARAY